MQATGIVRRIDDLGRVVIPKEIRRTLRLRDGTPLEVYVDGNDSVVYRKYSPLTIGQNTAAAKKALQKESIQFAIYDTLSLVEGNRSGVFPSLTPNEWLDNRSVFSCENKTVFPIVTDGDLLGFIAVTGSEKNEYVKAIVAMISAGLSE